MRWKKTLHFALQISSHQTHDEVYYNGVFRVYHSLLKDTGVQFKPFLLAFLAGAWFRTNIHDVTCSPQ